MSKTPAIGGLPRLINNGELFVKAFMVDIISDLVLFLNVGKTMNEGQISITADMLIKQYNYFKPEDFKILFDRIKIGYYGKQYDRVDGQTIFECAHQYDLERTEAAEQMSFESHTNRKKSDPNLIHPEVANMYREALKLRQNRPSNVATEIKVAEPGSGHRYEAKWVDEAEIEKELAKKRQKPKIEKSPRDKFIQACFDEFYKKWNENPYKAPKRPKSNIPGIVDNGETGGRFIEIETEKGPMVVDEVEYVQIRVKEFDQSNQ